MPRRNDTITQFDFDILWTQFSSDKRYLLCVSERDLSVLLSSIRHAGWPSRWFGSSGLLLRDEGRLSDLESALTFTESLERSLLESMCIDLTVLAESIRYLGDRIYDKPCCASGAAGTGSGTGTAGAGSTAGDYETGTDDEMAYPAGFASYAEYRAYKCRVATFIVGRMKSDIQNMQTVNLVGQVAIGLAPILGPILLTPVPFDDLIALCAILAIAVGYSGVILGEIEGAFTDDFDNLVCALMDSYTANDAETALNAALSTAIDNQTSDALTRTYAKQIAQSFVGPDSLAGLFEKDDTRVYPDATCDCNAAEPNIILLGTVISGDLDAPGTLVMQSAMGAFAHSIDLRFVSMGWTVQLVSLTETTFNTDSFYVSEDTGAGEVEVYEGTTPTYLAYADCYRFAAGSRSTQYQATFALSRP